MCELAEKVDDSISPHLAREMRKNNGSPEGTLKCEICGEMNANRNRQRTNYVNSDNMATLCPDCQDEVDEFWDERWDEYYSMIL